MANVGHFSIVLFLFCCVNQAATEIYWVTTDTSSLQAANLTISQFTSNSSDYLSPNTTLIFLPGTHYLTGNFTVSDLINFSMTSESTTAHIVCTNHSIKLHFNHSQNIHISKLEFIGCGGNLINNVVELVVQYVVFQGNENSGTALHLIDTTAQIANCTFVANSKGNFKQFNTYKNYCGLYLRSGYVGGAIVATNCKIDIIQSTFSNNGAGFGGVLFAEQSTINVNSSVLNNNTATWCGGALLFLKSNTKIEASEFDNNFADDGGVVCSDRSNISIEASVIGNNFAYDGGVVCSGRSTIAIETSVFANNSARLSGGVLLSSSGSNTTIEESEFKNNSANSYGGVLYSESSNIAIEVSEFRNNSAGLYGGVLYSENGNNTIEGSEFDNNSATFGGVLDSSNSNITIEYSEFDNNSAFYGGVLDSSSSNIIIEESEFDNNSASSGGVLDSSNSKITIERSKFDNNSASSGGVLDSSRSNIIIKESEFDNNSADGFGGVLDSSRSTITIEESTFDNNSARYGGVLDSSRSKIIIEESEFHNNSAAFRGGVLDSSRSNTIIEESEFNNNSARFGGVLDSARSTTAIEASEFHNNFANYRGGVLESTSNSITIKAAKFNNNSAKNDGGVLNFHRSNIIIEASVFDNNRAPRHGGVLFSSSSSYITIDGGDFTNNNSSIGAVILAEDNSTVNSNSLTIANNTAERYAVIYLVNSIFIGDDLTFSHNFGSLVAFNSNVTLIDNVVFVSNQPLLDNFLEGGAVTLFQSNIFFGGTCSLQHNHAENGGAVLSVESKLYVKGHVTLARNTASRSGGGVYLSNSELYCQRKSTFELLNNTAEYKGGGIHAISSSVRATSSISGTNLRYSGTILLFTRNTAVRGGGISLEANARLYILKHNLIDVDSRVALTESTVNFTGNNAAYGGAVYVDDNTNAGTCASIPKTECFFQVFAIHNRESKDLVTKSMHFSDNFADIAGSTLYGGLLDRCALSRFAEVNYKRIPGEEFEYPGNGLLYFSDISGSRNSSISSHPIQVCFCVDNRVNCTSRSHIVVKKGETFTMSLVTVDQTGYTVNGTIQASLHFTESGLSEGQLTREIPGECTNLTFNVVSPQNKENLTLYASDGPCKDAELSILMVEIRFLPCSCPIGFQVSANTETSCTCECHRNISQYVGQCDSHSESFFRKPQSRPWISYTNETGYLVYDNCPFDYCNSSSLSVNLNQPNGSDAQCVFNRTSLLCGSCQLNLSLSLGSSQCLSCPSYWPAIFITITIVAVVAGIALVALLLLLNMSVAVGTLNGLIFYANVVNTNKSILLPFQEPNFLTVFISSLNLELGIDTCYFPGMDTYIKTWLQLAFSAYVILLVVLVIVISSYSDRFSNLIGKKDPVATLATLILFSYAKLLEISFKSLSVGILEYPDGLPELLWLPDATVRYLSGKHIPLFIVAILILLVGLFYTVLLFSWQWILYLPRWRIFRWSTHAKLQTFIETYHTPFTPRHRYWTGFLLMVRAVLYLAAAANISNDPTIALTVITFTIGMILVVKGFIGSRMYRKWSIDILDTFFYWNVLFLAVFTWYSLDKLDGKWEAAAYISVITTAIALLLIVFYHVYTYTTVFSRFKRTKAGKKVDRLLTENGAKKVTNLPRFPPDEDIHRFDELLDIIDHPPNTDDYKVPNRLNQVGPTQSVVEVYKPKLALSDKKEALQPEVEKESQVSSVEKEEK